MEEREREREREGERELEIETEEQSMLLSVYGYVVTITSVSLYIGARKGRVSSARVLESPGEVIGYTFASLEDTFSNGNLPPTGIRLPLN